MAIWTYEESKSEALALGFGSVCSIETCTFCASPLNIVSDGDGKTFPWTGTASDYYGICSDYPRLQTCPVCGWWVSTLLTGRAPHMTHDGGYLSLYRACGTLRDLDLTDLSVPVEEVRRYLLAKYADRFHVHPKKYEDLVGSVFADFGFKVRVTAYSGDDGIDAMVFDGKDNATVGIQVKRQRGKITAEQIRAFVGALVLKNLTSGVYVTTSTYQVGAERTACAALRTPGVAISLMDAERFYDALMIARRECHQDPSDASAPYHRAWKVMSAKNLGGAHIDAPYVFGHSW